MIEPTTIVLPRSTLFWATNGTEENGRPVRYYAGFFDLDYTMDSREVMQINGRAQIWKEQQVPKRFPLWSAEKRKWVRTWIVGGQTIGNRAPYLTLIGRHTDDLQGKMVNAALTQDLVFDRHFVSVAFAPALLRLREIHDEVAPQIMGEQRIKSVA